MTLVAGIGENATDIGTDRGFHLRDDCCQRMSVIRIAGERLGMQGELATLGAMQRGGNRYFDADLWTTPALQVGFGPLVEAVCANLSGFNIELLL